MFTVQSMVQLIVQSIAALIVFRVEGKQIDWTTPSFSLENKIIFIIQVFFFYPAEDFLVPQKITQKH